MLTKKKLIAGGLPLLSLRGMENSLRPILRPTEYAHKTS